MSAKERHLIVDGAPYMAKGDLIYRRDSIKGTDMGLPEGFTQQFAIWVIMGTRQKGERLVTAIRRLKK